MVRNNMNTWSKLCGIGFACIIIAITTPACDAFVGPATQPSSCPVYCSNTKKCCNYDELCSKYEDRPCLPPLIGLPNKEDRKKK